MNNTDKKNKLVEKGNSKTKGNKWSDIYGKVVVDRKTYTKFVKAFKKNNKRLGKEYQLTLIKAGSEALNLWIEKNG